MILLGSEVSHQSLRTRKESHDPEREVKTASIEQLTRMPHDPPVVLSGDEPDPIRLMPQGGAGGFPRERPGRIPVDYQRTLGRATTS